MRVVRFIMVSVLLIVLPFSAHGYLSMELTQGVSGAVPVAVVPFLNKGAKAPQSVSDIVANDLQNSGHFKVFGKAKLEQEPHNIKAVSSEYFQKLGAQHVVVGKMEALRNGRYKINVELVNVYETGRKDRPELAHEYTVRPQDLRKVAHHISDLIFEKLTGVKGVFSTKLAYVVIKRKPGKRPTYILEVSDQDGYNPRPLLTSYEPIMSPSWSPNGRQIAYVSFEHRRASIFIQDVVSGVRRRLSSFPGINGAPAWSPNGRQLAIVLSKAGSPNIYTIDIASHKLKQLTNDYYINTEPSFAPDGKSLVFTTNRSGGPQIYQVNLGSGKISRVTYDGSYNARASYTRDGNSIAMIHRVDGLYKIAVLNLNTGKVRVLNQAAGDSASPSISPNGRMVLYDMLKNGRNVLGMASADGRIQVSLPARDGDAQDPAWSPYLS